MELKNIKSNQQKIKLILNGMYEIKLKNGHNMHWNDTLER